MKGGNSMEQKCIFCKSSLVVKNGSRKRRVRSKQSFFCLSCEKQFVEPDGFERMRHKPNDIVRAVSLRNDGLSLLRTQDHIWQHDGVKVTRRTISQWTKKYSVFLKSNTFASPAKIERKT